MNDAVLYKQSNNVQRLTVEKVLNEFVPLLQWRKDGYNSALDIGCGTGDVTVDLILPILSQKCNLLVACDINDEMLKFARDNYNHPKVTFEKLDIGDIIGVDDFLKKFDPFDHVLSFFCLHWVQNQKRAMQNIYRLLKTNGECLLLFLTSSPVFAVYEEMSKSRKWSHYLTDVEDFIPPHQKIDTPSDEFRSICLAVGFTSCHFQVQELKQNFETFDDFKNFYRSVNPFVNRVLESEREMFILEITTQLIAKHAELNETKYCAWGNVMIVHARK